MIAECVFIAPAVLEGKLSAAAYNNWVRVKAWTLYKRDRKRKLPASVNASIDAYKETVNNAVASSGPFDPYSGDALRWELIGTWDTTKGIDDYEIFRKIFVLLPTVDHRDPTMKELDFELCSWMINCCKSNRTPEEFIGLCATIYKYRGGG